MNDIDGPAADIPEYYAALMLLQVRGCTVTWRCLAPNAIAVYEVGYRREEDLHALTKRTRLLYPDHRGTQQALGLLRELSFDVPSTANLDDVVKTGLEV